MATRITSKQLDALANNLNKASNSPLEPYTRVAGKLVANIGNFHISGAYGGYALHRMVNTSGGITSVFNSGYMTTRELHTRMEALLKGFEMSNV
jgi:hypothetical protein